MAERVRINRGAWDRLQARLLRGPQAVRVGVLSAKGGHDQYPDTGATVLEVATIHEFGAPRANIPERSFLRRGITRYKREITAEMKRLAARIFEGKMTRHEALDTLGRYGADLVRRVIVSDSPPIPPALEPGTIIARRRRGNQSIRPLYDTGRLARHIAHEVEK
jgi:hypothetical protein